MPDRGVCLALTLALLAFVCGTAAAEDAKQPDPAADAELLEFLGSVDSGADSQTTADDGSWIEYLAQTDIGKVAKTANPDEGSRKKAAADQPPDASGDKKND